ncbi:MAG: ATP-binding cassette domain-containing protein [Methylococcus sp.]|nr:MAG: ATP-binding cassette domain-containing protein [Methylococcus sp.]
MINARSLTLRRGTRVLFEDASFTLNKGDRIGITGANGAGKSSFFELILERLHADGGELTLPPGLEISHVAQETPAVECSALDYVLDGDRELRAVQARLTEAEQAGDGLELAHLHEQYGHIGGYEANARAARLLNGLGFAPGQESRRVSEFSGGWRVRLNVAQALMCRSDVLLLDEPTNHLDLDAVIWLQEWLAGYSGTLLLVSHDRDFLDDLATHILHIEQGRVTLHTGNYSAFETRRAEQLAQQQASWQRQQRELQRVQGFIDRFRAQATKARQVQSRVKALDRMSLIAQAQADSPLEFSFQRPEKSPSPLLKLDGAAAGYGQHPIIEGVELTINPGDRIGLLGPNGAGKSTFVKLLAGILPVISGERLPAQDLKIGYFAQHQLEQLNPEESALRHLQRLDAKALEKDLRNYLGGFGFRGDQAMEPIAPFSGGEKSRLVLAMLIYQRPNLLLLDEPTNHLDLQTRDALSLALQDYEGALVVVSHDRYLLRTVADDLWLVAQGRVEGFDGDLDDYRRWLNEHRQRIEAAKQPANGPGGNKPQRRGEADRRRQIKPLMTALDRAEQVMNQWLEKRRIVEDQLADAELYESAAKDRLDQLLAERARIEASIHEAENRWLEATEALEAATAD